MTTRMKYTCSIAMGPIDQLIDIAKTAEEVGFDAIALPDSLFYMEKAAADYPYTPDGSRMWDENTPWVDPLIATAAMGAVTSTLRFYTNVMKLGSRNPLLLARQVGSVANLTNNRFGFGVGRLGARGIWMVRGAVTDDGRARTHRHVGCARRARIGPVAAANV